MSATPVTKSKAEVNYVRQALKEAIKCRGLNQRLVAEMIGLNEGNVSRFLSNRQDLSCSSIETIYAVGLVERPTRADLSGVKNGPLSAWAGEVKPAGQVAAEKGYCQGTILKYCKDGRLDYVKRGRRYFVVVNEKYDALQETELGRLRRENSVLRTENQSMKEQIESMQLTFRFGEPAREIAADGDHVAVEIPLPEEDAQDLAVDDTLIDDGPAVEENAIKLRPSTTLLFQCSLAGECQKSATCAAAKPHAKDVCCTFDICYDYRNNQNPGKYMETKKGRWCGLAHSSDVVMESKVKHA